MSTEKPKLHRTRRFRKRGAVVVPPEPVKIDYTYTQVVPLSDTLYRRLKYSPSHSAWRVEELSESMNDALKTSGWVVKDDRAYPPEQLKNKTVLQQKLELYRVLENA